MNQTQMPQLTSIPIVMIIVCSVLGLNAVSGLIRGFVRKISGIAALLLAGILVTFLLPVITNWLHTTPVYGYIRGQCETIGQNLVRDMISGALGGADTTAVLPADVSGGEVSAVIDSVRSDDGSGSFDRGKIKEQLQAMGYDPSIIDSLSDAELESYAQQLVGSTAGLIPPAVFEIGMAGFSDSPISLPPWSYMLLSEDLPSAGTDPSAGSGTSGLLSQATAGMSRADQMRFIENLPLPQWIKDQIETFNNENGYQKLGANDFGSYMINYIASLILNILAYVVTFFVVWLVIRLILGALAVSRRLPVIGTADRLLGLLLGMIQGILIVWVLFLVLSLFSTTPLGAGLMREISESGFLSALYNYNPFLKIAAGAIKGIM